MTNDVEVADRLNEFFQYCQEQGEMPTVEKLALALGTYVAKIKQWERGRDLLPRMTDATPELIKKAKQMIAATDAELVIRGNLNPLPYMFRAKNYYGMSDKSDSEVANVDKVQSKEELAQKYADVVDVEYSEKKKGKD